MSMMNIDALHKINEDRLKQRLKIYDEILKKCHERIKAVSKSPKGTTFCFYIIPNYVYGTPLYDVNACIVYMVQYLMKNGFYVAYTHPNLLYISWFKRTNSIEYKKQSKPFKEKEEFKKIESFKPKNDFLYDIDSMNFLNKKKDNLFNL